jgi:hypothetical protein
LEVDTRGVSGRAAADRKSAAPRHVRRPAGPPAASPSVTAPWALNFSCARAIQQPALQIWAGKDANRPEAQRALLHRAICNRAARRVSIAPTWKRTSGEAGRSAGDHPRPAAVVLFGHGETLWSLSGRHTGVTDIPLTVHGETQARALRPWVGAIAFSTVLTSPGLRAHATCELAGLGGRAQIEPDLAEWNKGTTRAGAPSTFVSSARVGTFFETAARAANRPSRSANASAA